ncbi:MAG: deoxyribodipyrimidine photo-lyase [Gammaproteobacteria bacterium]|nr:deoxyribodipyrimidine photo-lyase [Gammaproteobacteria bacterium]
MSTVNRQLVWLKTADLRVSDNSALYLAAAAGPLLAAFVITPEQYSQHDDAEIKQDFWYRNLINVRDELLKLNIPLKILSCPDFDGVPDELFKLAVKHNVETLHFNKQYELNERACEQAVRERFEKNDIAVESYTDSVMYEPGQLRTQKGDFYTVFTPFKKLFLREFEHLAWRVWPKPKKQESLDIQADDIDPWIDATDVRSDLWPSGETAAKRRLSSFIKNRVSDYKNTRDFPAVNGTSTLSPYLTSGVLSIRQCFQALGKIENLASNPGALTWQSELIWREFYKHILIGFPRVSQHLPFKEKTRGLQWNHNQEHFQAWCEGQTGIPIVDAAMRQLVQTGWMHNRLRMVTAMFLSKNLFLDWRQGEKFFMQHLIDGDLSANNGGWQWSASTGTDAAPYFRIFNPVSQSERFDPQGKFIRKFVPELKNCDNKSIHNPWNAKVPPKNLDYPRPIVDLKITRQLAIDKFKELG